MRSDLDKLREMSSLLEISSLREMSSLHNQHFRLPFWIVSFIKGKMKLDNLKSMITLLNIDSRLVWVFDKILSIRLKHVNELCLTTDQKLNKLLNRSKVGA